MPAKSKSQQRLFGMVHAYQKGKLKDAPEEVKEIARSISDEDAEHFAKTKHKGLPEKKAEIGERANRYLMKYASSVPKPIISALGYLRRYGTSAPKSTQYLETLQPFLKSNAEAFAKRNDLFLRTANQIRGRVGGDAAAQIYAFRHPGTLFALENLKGSKGGYGVQEALAKLYRDLSQGTKGVNVGDYVDSYVMKGLKGLGKPRNIGEQWTRLQDGLSRETARYVENLRTRPGMFKGKLRLAGTQSAKRLIVPRHGSGPNLPK